MKRRASITGAVKHKKHKKLEKQAKLENMAKQAPR
jgi:hypothetical protein